MLRVAEAAAELAAANRRLELLVTIDALTGLASRRRFSEFLDQEWQRATRDHTSVALLMLDVDFFKRFNDTRGHQAGDEVLRRVASRLLSTVRGDDAICRLGGDEFLVLMANTDAAIASRIAERIRHAITSTPIPTRDGAVSVSVSVGCTVRAPGDAAAVDALLERADQALMQSKAAGRNRVQMTS